MYKVKHYYTNVKGTIYSLQVIGSSPIPNNILVVFVS